MRTLWPLVLVAVLFLAFAMWLGTQADDVCRSTLDSTCLPDVTTSVRVSDDPWGDDEHAAWEARNAALEDAEASGHTADMT